MKMTGWYHDALLIFVAADIYIYIYINENKGYYDHLVIPQKILLEGMVYAHYMVGYIQRHRLWIHNSIRMYINPWITMSI